MLENWLTPVPKEGWMDSLGSHSMGKKMLVHDAQGVPSLKKTKVALIGVGVRECQRIRQELYGLTFAFQRTEVADLGNLKRKKIPFGIPLVKELLDSQIIPLVLAPDPAFAETLYDAFKETHPYPSFLQVDEQLHLGPGDRMRRLLDKRPFHLSLIGAQAHFFQPDEVRLLDQRHFDLVRLGKAKADMPEIEPILRDADLMSFHLQAMKPAEMPGLEAISPSGFQLEEGCQILRYAGLSDKLKAGLITGFTAETAKNKMSAAGIALLIWYFLEGVSQRKQDYPVSVKGMTEYVVQVKNVDIQIVFWKSQKSGRWWMQIPVKRKNSPNRHRLVPCSYSDYLQSREGSLPDRLIYALDRFE